MNVETTVQAAGEIDDPEVAFEAMSRKLAGLTAVVEGFAARQQELHARDYGPDLAKIHERWGKVVDAFKFLAKKAWRRAYTGDDNAADRGGRRPRARRRPSGVE